MLTKNTDQLRANVAKHVAADSIVQGIYWDAENDQGCFIGCLSHSNDPTINEQTYGLPVMIQRIAENIFEALPPKDAKEFFAALPDAVGCDGKDLSKVGWQFLASELRALPKLSLEIQAVIAPVIAGMDQLAQGLEWAKEDADAAGRELVVAWARPPAQEEGVGQAAALVAAISAAAAIGAAAARETQAAWARPPAPEEGAWAWVATWAASADGETLSARLRQRDTLLRLISEAPVA